MAQSAHHVFTFEHYLQLEGDSTVKHEFLDGRVWAMSGGSPRHAAIAARLIGALTAQLRGRPCEVYTSDLRIRVAATGLGTYPDASVVCGPVELDSADPKGHTIVNPKVVLEVLSPSTEEYDRGDKLEHYKRIPSLEEVVLVAQDVRCVDLWRRNGERWTRETLTAGVAHLESIGCDLDLDELYRDPLAT